MGNPWEHDAYENEKELVQEKEEINKRSMTIEYIDEEIKDRRLLELLRKKLEE